MVVWVAVVGLALGGASGLVVLGRYVSTGLSERRGAVPLADDPEGAQACGALDRWLRGGRQKAEADVVAEAAPHAIAARSASIRAPAGHGDAVNPDGSCCYPVYFVDLRRLHGACVAAGVDLPPY
jgi:hypothetical protein